ncbi:MAG: hypothetical protein MUC57_14780 [Desulfobacterales bacterium]|nr:hypothetical protein [Desulfobacterales bacterium]
MLWTLYSSGYRVLRDNERHPVVEGIFISDCGVLFSRKTHESDLDALDSLLQVLAVIHRDVFESAFSLTTSIAFGDFTYRGKVEFEGLEKNAIHGHAYLSAFKDNESQTRKLYPNECRILKAGLPPAISMDQMQTLDVARGRIRDEDKHFYFEWMKRQ